MRFAVVSVLAVGLTMPCRAVLAEEPSDLALRVAVDLGGTWASNVYGNAAQVGDVVGLGRARVDADWAPADTVIVKATYRGDLDAYRDVEAERVYDQVGELTLGLRPFDTVYLWLAGGGEHAYYPDRPIYTFAGGFGRAGARVELGDTLTAKAMVRLRHDTFADYDLDNTSYQGEASVMWAAGDHVELELPAMGEIVRYGERFLLDASGTPTSTPRTGRRLVVEPQLRVFPSFAVRLRASVRGEINTSDDTYYFTGPFGVGDPAVPPQLMPHFDSYRSVAGALEARLEPRGGLSVGLRVSAGVRSYDRRPAFDPTGAPTSDLQSDRWIEPGAELRVRLGRNLSVWAAYLYVRQWSNDPLWAYDAHRVQLATTVSFGT